MGAFRRWLDRWRRRNRGGPPGAPGASDPGKPGYDGRIAVGDEGGAEDTGDARPETR